MAGGNGGVFLLLPLLLLSSSPFRRIFPSSLLLTYPRKILHDDRLLFNLLHLLLLLSYLVFSCRLKKKKKNLLLRISQLKIFAPAILLSIHNALKFFPKIRAQESDQDSREKETHSHRRAYTQTGGIRSGHRSAYRHTILGVAYEYESTVMALRGRRTHIRSGHWV